jgi:hypothetical protein
MRTRRQFGEINTHYRLRRIQHPITRHPISAFVTFSAISCASAQIFIGKGTWLPTLLIIATFLSVSNRRTKQCWSVFLCYSKQSNFSMETNKLFYNYFFHISPTAFDSIMPSLIDIGICFNHRLSLYRMTTSMASLHKEYLLLSQQHQTLLWLKHRHILRYAIAGFSKLNRESIFGSL